MPAAGIGAIKAADSRKRQAPSTEARFRLGANRRAEIVELEAAALIAPTTLEMKGLMR